MLSLSLGITSSSTDLKPAIHFIYSPIDTTITIDLGSISYSTGAIVVDSAAPGIGIVIVNGIWSLQ